MSRDKNIDWLLEGDVSIQYQTYRDLLGVDNVELQKRIQKEGWGRRFLKHQNKDGHWGREYYMPKWTSTHYTLMTLKNLGISPDVSSIQSILDQLLYQDRNFEPAQKAISTSILYSDVCLNGMFLNFASYYLSKEPKLNIIVDFILSQQMDDGGFNCQKIRKGARHSSLHSTLSVLEGFDEYLSQGNEYRKDEIVKMKKEAEEFILMHRLYLSDRTGYVINKAFLKFPYPCRWRYDILRAMDYFQKANVPFDERMEPAIDHILSKRTKNGRWKVNAKYSGESFFEMEKAGKESRINTLRVLRVMKRYLEFTGMDLVYNDLLIFE